MYSTVYIDGPPGVILPMWAQGSFVEASRTISLRLLVILPNHCRFLRCIPYMVLLRIQDSPGWRNGHPMGCLMIVFLLSDRVVLQKGFFSILGGINVFA